MSNFDLDRLKVYLTKLIEFVAQPDLGGIWEYTVVASDFGTVDANPLPAALAAGLPPVVGVECWPSVIGGASKLPSGTVVLLVFRNRSKTAPCIIAINPPATSKPTDIEIDAGTKINIGGGTEGAARVSDSVTGPAGGVTGTCPGGSGGALTAGTLVSASVQTGSSKVVIG